jgi:hypothetical protein
MWFSKVDSLWLGKLSGHPYHWLSVFRNRFKCIFIWEQHYHYLTNIHHLHDGDVRIDPIQSFSRIHNITRLKAPSLRYWLQHVCACIQLNSTSKVTIWVINIINKRTKSLETSICFDGLVRLRRHWLLRARVSRALPCALRDTVCGTPQGSSGECKHGKALSIQTS